MKKFMTKLSVALLTASMAVPCLANAESVPTFYFSARESSDFQTDSDGTIVINREALSKNGGLTLTTDVFFQTDGLEQNFWYVSPKWKCPTSNITLTNLVDPMDYDNPIPFAFSETDENGNIINSSPSTLFSTDTELNTMAFTCRKDVKLNQGEAQNDPNPTLKPYGEKSDDYALTTFDMVFNRNIPYGEYEIYFLTEPVDYADQRVCEVHTRTSGKVETIETKKLKIKITGANLGDINNDGLIDAVDASIALIAYSASSVGENHGLTDEQFTAADINGNKIVNSNDASNILAYYSYISTVSADEEILSMIQYINQN